MAVSTLVEQPGLLEREQVREGLSAALAEAAAGRGRLVLVVGEAGVGKTAAVHEFCEAQVGSTRVLWGACDALFTPRPLGPFLDIADDGGGPLAQAIDGGARPHDVASALLRAAGLRTPTIVVLEDLHWADEASLDVVRVLARSVGRAPVLVVATYRDDELERDHPLRIILGELATRRAVDHLPVSPLSPEAVAELAKPAGIDPDELYRQTSGNPFFVTEVLAAGDGLIPHTIRAAVLGRAARLSAPARDVLEAVAISPQRVEVWLFDALAGERAGALEECLEAGMLTSGAADVAFRHELARLAIEEGLEPRRKLALHQVALAVLAASPVGAPDVARLAHHAEAAGDVGAVLSYAPLAGARAASVGAHREAAAQYGRALRFADSLELEARTDLLRLYADSCYATDRCHDAIRATRELLECYRASGDRLKEGDTLRLLSHLQMCPESVTVAEPAARQSVALLEQFPPGAELAMAYANLAAICMNGEDAAGTRHWGERAVELAERLGEVRPLAHALNSLGTMEFLLHGSDRRGVVERSLAIALDAELDTDVLRAYSNMTWAAWRHRDYALAERFLQAGLARCREPDFDLWHLELSGRRACLRLDQGRFDEAVESAVLATGDPRSSPLPRIMGSVVLGLVGARRGDAETRTLLDEALALAAGSGELQRIGPAAAAVAEAAWLAGDQAAVAEATTSALALAVARESSWLTGQLACWRKRSGLDIGALPTVARPWSLELAGRHSEAAECWSELGCFYEAALALAQSDDEPSLRRAHDALRALRAPRATAIVARRLRERGVRGLARGPRPSTRSNPAQLTDREVEVLQQLGEGLKNAAIGERLFISPRTVDYHVSAILRKLDAPTRGEAVAAARRLSLLEDR